MQDPIEEILLKLREYGEMNGKMSSNEKSGKVLYEGILTVPREKASEMLDELSGYQLLKEYPLAFISHQKNAPEKDNMLRIKFKIFNKRDIV
jgi:hypothetical protein